MSGEGSEEGKGEEEAECVQGTSTLTRFAGGPKRWQEYTPFLCLRALSLGTSRKLRNSSWLSARLLRISVAIMSEKQCFHHEGMPLIPETSRRGRRRTLSSWKVLPSVVLAIVVIVVDPFNNHFRVKQLFVSRLSLLRGECFSEV